MLWTLHEVSLPGRLSPRVDRLTVEIPSGVTAILGQSGAGKTSLLNLLVGFERPSAGQFQSSGDRSPAAKDAGPDLFWSPPGYGLWPHLTVREHLATVGSVSPDDRTALLAAFDLQSLSDARPGTLSLGERSRLSVARALASGARVLVMDEPLAHVDPARVGAYWSAIRSWRRDHGASLVIATHSPEVVLREADHVICLTAGRLGYSGSVSDLYLHPRTAELAAMLGPCNWLSAEDQSRWLAGDAHAVGCVRPERLSIEADPAAPVQVEAARFAGSSAEVDVVHVRDGSRRTFVHRPSGTTLKAGDRVLLRLLLLLVAMLAMGCSDEAEPTLRVKAESYWNMPPDGTRVPAPRGMTVSAAGEYLVLDNAGRILDFDADGKLKRQWWMPEYSVGKPEGICVLKDGRIVVADTHYHRVVIFDHDGKVLGTFGTMGEGPGEFIYPVSIVQDDEENLYVCEYGNFNDRVQKFKPDGTYIQQIGEYGTGDGQFQRPSGAAWFDGRIYVVDAFNNRVQVFDKVGKLVAILGTSDKISDLYYPYDISISEAGELYVVEYGAGRVSKYDRSGKLLGRYGQTGPGKAQLTTPWGLAVDGRGRVYVCDTGNRRIVELEL